MLYNVQIRIRPLGFWEERQHRREFLPALEACEGGCLAWLHHEEIPSENIPYNSKKENARITEILKRYPLESRAVAVFSYEQFSDRYPYNRERYPALVLPPELKPTYRYYIKLRGLPFEITVFRIPK